MEKDDSTAQEWKSACIEWRLACELSDSRRSEMQLALNQSHDFTNSLEARIQKLEEALRFYADEKNWEKCEIDDFEFYRLENEEEDEDLGAKAREALK